MQNVKIFCQRGADNSCNAASLKNKPCFILRLNPIKYTLSSLFYLCTSISTWCRAVNPSTLAVLMSAPLLSSLATSSVSPLEHAAKNIHPSWNLTFLGLSLGVSAALFVSDSSQRFNWSCLFSKALVCFESSAMTAAPLNTQVSRYPVKSRVQPKMVSKSIIKVVNGKSFLFHIVRSPIHNTQRCCFYSRIKEDVEGIYKLI